MEHLKVSKSLKVNVFRAVVKAVIVVKAFVCTVVKVVFCTVVCIVFCIFILWLMTKGKSISSFQLRTKKKEIYFQIFLFLCFAQKCNFLIIKVMLNLGCSKMRTLSSGSRWKSTDCMALLPFCPCCLSAPAALRSLLPFIPCCPFLSQPSRSVLIVPYCSADCSRIFSTFA